MINNTNSITNAVFFDISKVNIFKNKTERKFGSFCLKYKNAKPKVITPEITTPNDHTPGSKGSGVTGLIPGITAVSDTKIKAGKITETKLIKTILIENKKTIQGII